MLSKKNGHERDERIRFEEENHKYFVDECGDYISTTTLIKNFFPKFDSDLIITKMQKSFKWPSSPYFGLDREEIKHQWKNKADNAAKLGTLLHLTIENYYNEITLPLDNRIEKEYGHFLKFLSDEPKIQTLKPFRTEWYVFHEDYHIAGSIDMTFVDPSNGDLHIYDWKRTPLLKKENQWQKGFNPISHLEDCNFNHYSLQLNVYKFILENKYGYRVADMNLVCMHPDNENYAIENVPILQDEVKSLFEKNLELKLYLPSSP